MFLVVNTFSGNKFYFLLYFFSIYFFFLFFYILALLENDIMTGHLGGNKMKLKYFCKEKKVKKMINIYLKCIIRG